MGIFSSAPEVITVGMAIGTLFTLIVLPVMYSTLASQEQPVVTPTPAPTPSQPTIRMHVSKSINIPKQP